MHTQVRLADLRPPHANPRHDVGDIEGLADSIAHDGLLQNLVVTKGRGKTFRIVSGERRFRALEALRQRGTIDDDFPVSVEVRANLSKDDALRLASVENLQRQDLPPLDAAKALAALIKDGEKLDDIAAQTGLSVTTIRRRVALNMLCDEAKDALREGTLSL